MRRTAEAVIIGGGCMGASVAYHLTRLGMKDVVLVEREPMLGMGSTGKNAGGVRHQFSTEANVRLSIESIGLLEAFEQEVGYTVDFWQHGYLFLLTRERDVRSFQDNVAMQRRLGIDVDMLTPEDARRLAPGLEVNGVVGATFCARDGIADPNGVTQGFAKAAREAGAEICRDTEVTGLVIASGEVRSVETNRGSIATRIAINAAGPHAANIGRMAGVQVPVRPYRRHIFITAPLDDSINPRVPSTRIMVIDFETSFYFHREGAGILFGMSDPDEPPSFNTTVSWEFLERVTPIAAKRLPRLADAPIAHAWAGLYEMTPDAMPIIGPVRDLTGFYLIAGFSGHGFQHSPAAGRVLAELVVRGSVANFDLAPFRYERFERGVSEPELNVV